MAAVAPQMEHAPVPSFQYTTASSWQRVRHRDEEEDDDDDEQTSRLDSRDGLRLCAEKSATADTARLLTWLVFRMITMMGGHSLWLDWNDKGHSLWLDWNDKDHNMTTWNDKSHSLWLDSLESVGEFGGGHSLWLDSVCVFDITVTIQYIIIIVTAQ